MSHLQDPVEVCRSLLGQLNGRNHKHHAAEAARLPDLEVSIASSTDLALMYWGIVKKIWLMHWACPAMHHTLQTLKSQGCLRYHA